MTAAFVQAIGTGFSGASETTTVLSTTKTVTVGNTIFVGFGYYAAAGAESVADNLGNVYTKIEGKQYSTDRTAVLFAAPITVGGTLTTITATHPLNSYHNIVADEFSGVGTLASVGDAVPVSGTSVTWDNNKTIPANGIAVGVAINATSANTVSAGAASGTPSTSISLGSNLVSALSTALVYAIAGASDVTGFTGTATAVTSATWFAAGGNFNPSATGPVWTTPADTVNMSTTPELKFTSPASAVAQHFYLELDTANTFDTGNLRTYRSDMNQTNWHYWDGGAWVAMPSTGLPSNMAGNEIRYTVTDALSAATWYRRVRAGV